MDSQSAASAYTQAAVGNAPPLKIVHMLYEGALRFLQQAEAIDPQAQPAKFNERLTRADSIVSELRLSLDPQHAPELTENLNMLYLFVEGRIREAFLDRTHAPLPSARKVLDTLLEGWKSIELGNRAGSYGQTGS